MAQRKKLEKNCLSLLICLIVPILTWCQFSDIDSLERIVQVDAHDTTKLNALSQLYDHYIDRDLDKSLELVQQILSLSEQPEAQKYRCKGYKYLGTIQRKLNVELDTILSNFDKALSCCEDMNDLECKGSVLNSIGGAYHRNGLHVEAMTHYQQAVEIAEQVPDTLTMIACLGNMSSILKRRLDYDKALTYCERALNYAKELNNRSYIGMLTNNLASIHFNTDNIEKALELYEESLAIKREEGGGVSMSITLANIGGIHVNQERYEIAQKYLDEAYLIADDQNYVYGLTLSLRYMASAALKQNEFEKTIRLSREGLALLGPNSIHQYARDFHSVLSKSFENLGEPDSALVHLRTTQEINDTLFQAEKEQQIQQLEITYQVQQREVENQLLKAEQSYIEQKLVNKNYVGIGLIIALFLAGGWGFALHRNNQEKKRMNRLLESEVEERTSELREANEQLQQANYELKSFNHIASHDLKEPIRNVGNYVGLIQRRLPEEMKAQFDDYFGIIHQSTGQLYTLIEDIASYTQLSKDDSNLQAEVDLQIMVDGITSGLASFIAEKQAKVVYTALPAICSNSSLIFVALKNLIENGLKFNESSLPMVQVSYQSVPDHHRIVVTDNGIGVDPRFHEQIFTMFKRLHSMGEYPGSGIGLAMVKLAIEKLGGTVVIKSALREGSTFTIDLPKDGSGSLDEGAVVETEEVRGT